MIYVKSIFFGLMVLAASLVLIIAVLYSATKNRKTDNEGLTGFSVSPQMFVSDGRIFRSRFGFDVLALALGTKGPVLLRSCGHFRW